MSRSSIAQVAGITATISNEKALSVSLSIPTQVVQLSLDYETLANLPTLNGTELKGEMSGYFITPDDELSNSEIAEILK